MATVEDFKNYLKRQLSYRGNVISKLNLSKSTYYRHLKNPEDITLGELRMMVVIGELDEQKVMDFIYRR